MAFSMIALSLVTGVCVYASAAYNTNPIRSLGRPLTKSRATTFKASNLLGLRSFANILPETSIDITISIPRVVLVLLLTSTVLGRAMAIIKTARAIIRMIKSAGFSFATNEFPLLNPESELIFKTAVCSFFFQKYHAIKTGKSKNSQKNPGFMKVTSFIAA